MNAYKIFFEIANWIFWKQNMISGLDAAVAFLQKSNSFSSHHVDPFIKMESEILSWIWKKVKKLKHFETESILLAIF